MQPLAANGATGINISGIVTLNGGGELTSMTFLGNGTYINGSFSNKWEVEAGGVESQKDANAGGDLYVTSPSVTTISSTNTPVKAAGTTTGNYLFRVTSATNNRLSYGGTRTRKFKLDANISFTTGNSNQEISFYFAKNGSVLTQTRSQRKTGGSSDIGSIGISGIVELAPGDYVEVWVANNTSTSSVTIQHMNFSMQ